MTRQLKSDRFRTRLQSLSPWILATACTLLLVLLTLFAFQNYQREKALVIDGLGQRAMTLLRFIDSSIRTSIRHDLRVSGQGFRLEEHMGRAMEQAVEQPGVEFVLLVGSSGKIFKEAGINIPSESLDGENYDFARSVLRAGERRFVSRMITAQDGRAEKVQIASKYIHPGNKFHFGENFRKGRMMRKLSHHPDFKIIEEQMTLLYASNPVYIVQLDFEQFSSPLYKQILQIVILFTVLLLVVTGGALSFLTLRGLKGSERRLGKLTAFADILVSSLPIGLIATDSEGAIQVYNKAAWDILEIEPDVVRGKSPGEALHAPLARMFSGALSAEENAASYETSISCTSGIVKQLQLASVVVLNDINEFGGEVLLIRDSTEMKSLEKELKRSERLASLGKMAAGVAHELRNPLSSIKGLTLILKKSFSTESREAAIAEILVGEVERLNRSISELLDYAKPARLTREKVNVSEIVEKTASLIEGDAESYNVQIQLEMGSGLPAVFVDRDKINQVFLNLFLNAVQAMPNGGLLRVTTGWEEPWVVVTVWDNGGGIEDETLQKVLDPYFTTKNDGTGLGLSLSNKCIEEHGGQLKITSRQHEFTRVRVLLPRL